MFPSVSMPKAEMYEPTGEVAPGFIQGRFDANVPPPPPATDDFAKTIIMADLYANQGLVDEARDIYEDILARDPDNVAVRQKLEALSSAPAPAQDWPEEEAEDEFEEQPAAEIVAAAPVTAPAPVVEPPPIPTPEPPAPAPESNAKVDKLEKWLSKVKRTEVGGV